MPPSAPLPPGSYGTAMVSVLVLVGLERKLTSAQKAIKSSVLWHSAFCLTWNIFCTTKFPSNK